MPDAFKTVLNTCHARESPPVAVVPCPILAAKFLNCSDHSPNVRPPTCCPAIVSRIEASQPRFASCACCTAFACFAVSVAALSMDAVKLSAAPAAAFSDSVAVSPTASTDLPILITCFSRSSSFFISSASSNVALNISSIGCAIVYHFALPLLWLRVVLLHILQQGQKRLGNRF